MIGRHPGGAARDTRAVHTPATVSAPISAQHAAREDVAANLTYHAAAYPDNAYLNAAYPNATNNDAHPAAAYSQVYPEAGMESRSPRSPWVPELHEHAASYATTSFPSSPVRLGGEGSPSGGGGLDEELGRIDTEIAHLQRSLEAATQQAETME